MSLIKLEYYLLFLLLIVLAGCNGNGDPNKLGIQPNSSLMDTPSTPPAKNTSGLFLLSGNNQILSPGSRTTQTLKVQLLENGSPVANRTISFSQKSLTGGSFDNPDPVTNGDGIAETHYTAGVIAESGTIGARYLAEEAEFMLSVTNQAGKTIELLSGNTQEGIVGQILANPYKVRVLDSLTGIPAANIAVRFQSLSVGGNFSGSLTETVLTNVYGEATASYTLGSSASLDSVKAYILITPHEFVTFQSLAKPGSVNLSLSVLTAAVGGLIADGNSLKAVTLTLKDAFGNTIPTAIGNSVVFSTTQGLMVGSAIDGGDGTYSQNVRAPLSRSAPSTLISATLNGSLLTSTVAIPIIAGNVDLSQSRVASQSPSIVADGVTTSLVTVSLKDQHGNQVSSGGEVVVITTTVGTLLGQVVDNGDGSYTQVLRSPTYTASAILGATVSGNPVVNTGAIAFIPGPVDLARSVLAPTPVSIAPDGLSTSLVILQLKDSFGNNLVSSVGNTINFLSDRGTWIGSLFDHGDGTYSRFLQAATQNSIATITATSSGTLFSDNALVYFSTAASAPSLFNSRVDLLGSDILPADGTTTTQVKVTLKDSSNTQMPAGGSLVQISTTAGTLIGAVTDNGNGTYTQTLRAGNSALATVVVTASVDGQNITDSASLAFYGSIHLTNSTLTSFPSAIEANNISTTLIVLKAFDANNTPIPVGGATGLTIAITTGTGTLSSSTFTDNGNGTYSQFLTAPGSSGSAILTAYKSGSPFIDQTGVEFFQPVALPATIDCTNIANYKNKALIIDNVTLKLNSHGVSSCASEFVFTNLILRNNAVLTHDAVGTSNNMYGIELTADQIFIDATSQINVKAKGFLSTSNGMMRVPAVGGAQNLTNYYIGGCHGGLGGRPSGSYTCLSYGNPFRPIELGSSGAFSDVNYWKSTAGGGRIKLKVLGTLSIDGLIKADGDDIASYNNLGGSGGSILIDTKFMTGTGTISANGAKATSLRTDCGGGGGGRVAIYYEQLGGTFATTPDMFSKIQVYGGLCSTSSLGTNGAAGTLYLKAASQTYGDLVVNNNGIATGTYASTPLSAPALSYATNLTSTVLTKIGGFVPSYTGRFAYEGFYLDPNTLQNSTSTKFDNQYYKVTGGDDNSIALTGGDPTLVNTNIMTQPYQLMMVFNNFELMGKAQISGNSPVLVLKGDLSSNDETSLVIQGLPPQGLDALNMSSVVIDLFDQSNILNDFTLKNWKGLTLKNGSASFTTPYTFHALTLDKIALTAAVQRKSYLFEVVGNLIMQNGASITQASTGNLLTPGEEYSIEMKAANFSMSADSSITAASKGYAAKNYLKCQTVGNREVANASFYAGSHGGNGGSGNTYGSFMNPYYSGESCFCSSTTSSDQARGAGGGIVRIDVGTGSMTVNGAISADGESVTYGHHCRTGGAGGSIYLSGGALTGSGTLSAIGGSGNSAPVYGSGGGGGRIALYATGFSGNFSGVSNQVTSIKAWGGQGNSKHGSAGTIYFRNKNELYGDLLLNNNGNFQHYSTPLKIPSGPSASVNESTLVMNALYTEQSLDTGFLSGLYLDPKTSQNATATTRDDTLFLVTGHSNDTLTTAPNLKSTGAVDGSPFSLVAILKHLEIINGAQLGVIGGGHLRIESGDLKGVDGQLSVPKLGILGSLYFDIGALQSSSFDQINWASTLSPIFGNSVTLTNSQVEFTSPAKYQGNLTLSASSITSKVKKGNYLFDLTGNLVLQNGATITQGPTGDLLTPGEEYSIEMRAANFTMSGDSTISAASKGYAARNYLKCQTVGNREVANTSYYAGSHGGNGGSGNTYGSFMNPYYSGESCFCSSTTSSDQARGAGGGIVRIDVGTGSMTVNGAISADGESVTYGHHCRTGGAGGSIYLSGGALTGSGTLSAIGGSGNSAPVYGSGGGGGRIALYATGFSGNFSGVSNQVTSIKAWGGQGNSKHGSAGTIYLKDKDDLHGDLLVNNNNNIKHYTTPLKIPSGITTSFGSGYLQMDSAHSEVSVDTDFITGLFLNANTNQNATTTSSDDQLVLVTNQDGDHLDLDGSISSTAQVGNSFSMVAILNRLEVRGLASLELKNGGHLRVNQGDFAGAATGALTIPISGITGDGYLDTTSILTTNFNSIDPSQYVRFVMNNNTYFNNSIMNSYNILKSGGNVYLDGTTLTVYRQRKNLAFDVAGSLVVQNASGIIQGSTGALVNPGEEYSVEINAGNFSMSSDSTITAASKGYLAKNYLKCQTVGNREVANASYYAGSHGGNGGSGNTYGSFMNPYFSGESCYCSYTTNGDQGRGAGGGIVRIDVGTGSMTVNGAISADGESVTSGYYCRTGGAGGSIYLSGGALTGSGSVSAIGGSGNSAPVYGSGGGGGRIALHATSFSGNFSSLANQVASIKSWGGRGNSKHGAAGTIYLRDKALLYGDLLINNNSNTKDFTTPLRTPAGGAIDQLTNTSANLSSNHREYTWDTGLLDGLYINPNTAQGNYFEVLSHLVEDITTTSGLIGSGQGAVNTNYALAAIFNNLYLYNSAAVQTVGTGVLKVQSSVTYVGGASAITGQATTILPP